MNSTDAGLRMCAGEIMPKLHLTSILSKAQIPGQAQASPRAKKGPLGSHTREGDIAHENDTSSIRGETFSTNQTYSRGSTGPPELPN